MQEEKARWEIDKDTALFFNKSCKQHPIKQQLYGHLSSISLTIQERWITHAGHCLRKKTLLISKVLLWTPIHKYNSVGWSAKTYIHSHFSYTGCRLENLPSTMANSDRWQLEHPHKVLNFRLNILNSMYI